MNAQEVTAASATDALMLAFIKVQFPLIKARFDREWDTYVAREVNRRHSVDVDKPRVKADQQEARKEFIFACRNMNDDALVYTNGDS